jgi:heme-degrading monooxygenase HmoA
MYSRVTLLEIDTLRTTVEDALALFKDDVLPQIRGQEGYEGALVLTTPEGKGLILTVWESEEAAARSAQLASGAVERHVTLFRSPPGRENYEVVLFELPGVSVR